LEYVVVVCKPSEDALDDPSTNILREVTVDGNDQSSGMTGWQLQFDAGPHDFDLGVPLNYGPPTMHVMLQSGSTSQLTPRRLTFWLV